MNYCRTHTDETQCGCNDNYRRVMAQPITREALGVEAALPPAFTQDPPKPPKPPIDWEAVWICGAVIVTFTAVMVLSAVS